MTKPYLKANRNEIRQLVSQLKTVLEDSANAINSEAQLLIAKIKNLLKTYRWSGSRRELRRILGATAIFFGLGISQQVAAQNFGTELFSPFGLDSSSVFSAVTLVDIDGDGDFDLFVGDLYISGYAYYSALKYYENTGTATAPQFAAPSFNPFGIKTDSVDVAILLATFGDVDGDGDQDLLMGGSTQGLYYFENTGTAQAPAFGAAVLNPFGLSTNPMYYGSPVLVDLDDDGDLDILSGEYDGAFVYYENTGTSTAPSFGARLDNPFGLIKTDYNFPSLGDVDWDGDMDIMVGTYNGDIEYFENTGTKASPAFAAPVTNPSNIVSSGTPSFVCLVDIDGDSDPDLFKGGFNAYSVSPISFHENLVTSINLGEFEDGLNVYPTLVEDIVSIEYSGGISFVKISDASGKKFGNHNWDGKRVDLSELAPGPYILEIGSKSGHEVRRKIIKK